MANPLTGLELKALDKVSAIRPVLPVASNGADDGKAFSELVRGEVYPARILGFSASGEMKVALNGKPLLLNMPQQLQVGETLMLKFISDEAGVGFKLMSAASDKTAQVNISTTAREVASLVKQAQQQGVAQVYQANVPVTTEPLNIPQFATELQHSFERSGLFYESHLADYVEGSRTLASLKQEPQNQNSAMSPHLLAQQLNVLETQGMQWRGEVWPGQTASWHVALDEQPARHDGQEASPAVSSQLNLELPCLGNVSAKLQLIGTQLQVSIVSDEADTADTLQKNANALVQSLKQHVSSLDTVFVLNEVRHAQ